MDKNLLKRTITLSAGKKTARLMPIGDIHYANKDHDSIVFDYYMNWLYEEENEDVLVLGMGDFIEGATKHSVGLYEQTMDINDQIDYIEKKFKPIIEQGRFLGMLGGNHEGRVKRDTGTFDLQKEICKRLNVRNLDKGIFLDLRVKKKGHRRSERYTYYAIHGASGAYTPSGKMNACMRLAQVANVECYLMGHVHALDHKKMDTFAIVRDKVIPVSKHFVITGSYLLYLGGYAQAKAYIPTATSGSPKIKMHVDMHRLSVSI